MRTTARGFTPLEILIVIAIVGMLAAIALPTYTAGRGAGDRAALVAEARRLHEAFVGYAAEHGRFPSTGSLPGRAFNRSSLDPLSAGGYLSDPGSLTARLTDHKVMLYNAPGGVGDQAQFWAVLELADDPRVVLLVCHTDRFPLDPGTWYDGVFYIARDRLIPATDVG